MLQVFNFDEATAIRTDVIEGNVYFVAKDMAEALEYPESKNALRLCKNTESSPNGELNKINNLAPATKWITESDMYRLIMRSTKPEAEKFQDWVCEEVLPSIRKTGSYSVPKQTDPLDERRLRLEEARLQKDYLDMMLSNFVNLSDNAKQVLAVKATETAFGEKLPFLLPVVETHLKSATEIAKDLGLTANRVGRITNQLGLKTEEFAECRLDKSAHSSKQVESWYYKPEAVEKVREFLSLTH